MRKSIIALVSLLLGIAGVGVAATPAQAACGTACYFHAGANQTVTNTGVSGLIDVLNPSLGASDYHTLAELTVESGTGNTIEVGWNKDPGLYGDNLTHFFVGAWKNGTGFLGYNTAGGFLNASGCTVCAGTAITGDVGTIQNFAIQHLTTPTAGWWIGYKGTWIGAYPDTIWSGGFTQGSIVQGFGEVASSVANPCGDMGTGVLPTSTTGARINTVKYITTGGVSIDTSLTLNLNVPGGNGTQYGTVYSPSTSVRSIRVGGPGFC